VKFCKLAAGWKIFAIRYDNQSFKKADRSMSSRLLPQTLFCIIIFFAIACAPSQEAANEARLPNIVLIYADDLGYGDLSEFWRLQLSNPSSGQNGKRRDAIYQL
jgi:hypothetical protein